MLGQRTVICCVYAPRIMANIFGSCFKDIIVFERNLLTDNSFGLWTISVTISNSNSPIASGHVLISTL